MSRLGPDLEWVRREACRLIRQVDWESTRRAMLDASALGHSECTAFDAILDWLESGCPLREVALGEPPDPSRLAYTLSDLDGRGLYVKFELDPDRFRLISFHTSKHRKG